jgi:hypothetical protein
MKGNTAQNTFPIKKLNPTEERLLRAAAILTARAVFDPIV